MLESLLSLTQEYKSKLKYSFYCTQISFTAYVFFFRKRATPNISFAFL